MKRPERTMASTSNTIRLIMKDAATIRRTTTCSRSLRLRPPSSRESLRRIMTARPMAIRCILQRRRPSASNWLPGIIGWANSDDQFKVTAGGALGTNVYLGSSETVPGERHDGQFDFVVATNGIYRLRLLQ